MHAVRIFQLKCTPDTHRYNRRGNHAGVLMDRSVWLLYMSLMAVMVVGGCSMFGLLGSLSFLGIALFSVCPSLLYLYSFSTILEGIYSSLPSAYLSPPLHLFFFFLWQPQKPRKIPPVLVATSHDAVLMLLSNTIAQANAARGVCINQGLRDLAVTNRYTVHLQPNRSGSALTTKACCIS